MGYTEMAEPNYLFSLEETAQALMIKQGIHEGLWSIAVEFTFIATAAGPSKDELIPAGIVGVNKLGLSKGDEANSLTFDAAKLNPAKRGAAKLAGKKPAAKKASA